MNEILFLQIMLFGLCVLGGIAILIFGLRQFDDVIDYDRIIRKLNELEENDNTRTERQEGETGSSNKFFY